jgi:hypothetical protein
MVWYPRSGTYLMRHEHLRRKVRQHTLRQQIFIVTFAGMQATERPEMAEMQSRKDTAIAKIAISQYLWKEPVN